jgi:thiamine biosynthesis lipoprotein
VRTGDDVPKLLVYNLGMTRSADSSRRDFLLGRAVAREAERALSDIAAAQPLPDECSPAEEETRYLVQFSRRAMACEFALWLNAGQHRDGADAAIAALDLLEPLEQQLSVYRSDSDVCQINQLASQQAVPVESQLFELLGTCRSLWEMSRGAFDPTAGPLIALWGFKYRSGRLPTRDEIATALPTVGFRHVILDEDMQTVQFAQAGVELNLGSVGKGHALDRGSQILHERGVSDFIFHGGNSSVLARGSRAGSSDGGWSVGIRHPLRPEHRLGELVLRNQALSTSGSGTQFFIQQGKRYGHVLDPRTGWPAEGVLSATVIAPTATEAEALSTACYVLGPTDAAELIAANPHYGAVMLCPGPTPGSLDCQVLGCIQESWRLY